MYEKQCFIHQFNTDSILLQSIPINTTEYKYCKQKGRLSFSPHKNKENYNCICRLDSRPHMHWDITRQAHVADVWSGARCRCHRV